MGDGSALYWACLSVLLVAAAANLDPQGRSRRWSSLLYWVLDAVWSIPAAT
jgi:hypothetical protein